MKNVDKHNISPSRVVLEILEDITSLGSSSTLKQIDSLRKQGFKIAIDDFGAENSNLSRLLEIQPDYLKIDGIFIKNIIEDKKSQIIVDAIVLMCKNSNIKIIAEFIHNEAVQKRVKKLGIGYSQGFYFGEPKPDLIELTVAV
jgi:EAL domain-containing protein (putative c-di-GMP-specific phosphodiesterase class I)